MVCGLQKARMSVHANIRLHADVPLAAFLSLNPSQGFAPCFCSSWNWAQQLRLHPRLCLPSAAALGRSQGRLCWPVFIGHLVPFQPMAKPQNGALVGQVAICLELGKLALSGVRKKAASIAKFNRLSRCCVKCAHSAF
jgi:hypothetical protein